MTKRSSGLTAKPLSSERSAGTSTWDRLNATITLLNIIDLLTVTIINICPTIWLFWATYFANLKEIIVGKCQQNQLPIDEPIIKIYSAKNQTERPTLTNHNWQTPLILPHIGIAHLLTRNSFARTMLYTATVLRNFSV